jgi:hypothetical protein
VKISKWWLLIPLVIFVGFVILVYVKTSQVNREWGDGVKPERLAGTVCTGRIGDSAARFHWSFTQSAFLIEARESPIPQEVLDELVGKGRSAKKIEGKWQIKGISLILTDVIADDQPTGRDGRFYISEIIGIEITVPGDNRTGFRFERPK